MENFEETMIMLVDMFPSLDKEVVGFILQESGNVDDAVNKLLELTTDESSMKHDQLEQKQQSSSSSAKNSPTGKEQQYQKPASFKNQEEEDAHLAYVLQMQLEEEDGATMEFEESQEKIRNQNFVKTKLSNDELNKVRQKISSANTAAQNKMKQLYSKITGSTGSKSDGKRMKQQLIVDPNSARNNSSLLEPDYMINWTPSPSDNKRRPSFVYDSEGNLKVKGSSPDVASTSSTNQKPSAQQQQHTAISSSQPKQQKQPQNELLVDLSDVDMSSSPEKTPKRSLNTSKSGTFNYGPAAMQPQSFTQQQQPRSTRPAEHSSNNNGVGTAIGHQKQGSTGSLLSDLL